MKIIKEFKEFATRGNVMDLAIGIIIGGAFQAIVTSLVNDIVMPAISIVTGNTDYSGMAVKVGEVEITYGNFIGAVINFLIIAFVIFMMMRSINKLNSRLADVKEKELKKLKKKIKKGEVVEEEPAVVEPLTKICPYCLTEIKYKATRCPHCTSELVEKLLDDDKE